MASQAFDEYELKLILIIYNRHAMDKLFNKVSDNIKQV